MSDTERLARDLYDRLRGLGELRIYESAGWTVEVRTEVRRCEVRCVNVSRRSLRRPPVPPSEPTYIVMLFEGVVRFAGGRTRDAQHAFSSVVAWTAGRSIEELEQSEPFLNEMRRRLRSLAKAIEASCGDVARCEIDAAEMDDLTIYGEGRACRVEPDDEGNGCAFFLGGVYVAFGDISPKNPKAVERWMRGCTLAELASLGIRIQPHAELLERGEHVRWHWMHVRDRIQDPTYAAASSRPLLERLAASDVATKFYTYTSHSIFCFSASSQPPWVSEGLPMIMPPNDDGTYPIRTRGDFAAYALDAAVELIEGVLAAYPIQPFWGAGDANRPSG